MTLSQAQRDAWQRDGFFIMRGFADPAQGHAMAAETIAAIRADPPTAHPGEPAYRTNTGLFVQPEAKPMDQPSAPEDLIAKVFNTHLSGTTRAFALDQRCGDIVRALLDDDVAVFQSMFIFKNPGAWGQPWHQDSFYFNFDKSPQVGLWLAISDATLTNGCLSVLPGSHQLPVLPHQPDRRAGANQGYLEVLGLDDSEAVPVLMAPGDLLVFHSHLLHKSVDNCCSASRQAMVLHYSHAQVRNLAEGSSRAMQDLVTSWQPLVRQAMSAG